MHREKNGSTRQNVVNKRAGSLVDVMCERMKECVRVALCDSKEPMPSIQDFYETDDLQVWTYFEPILHNDTHIAESEKHITQTTEGGRSTE